MPDGWRVAREGLRQTADIYAVYPSRDLYAAVLSERAAVLSQFDLEDNAIQYRRLIRSELDDYEGETRLGTPSIDGKPAVQYEIRGRVDGVPVVYLHTTVQGTDNYYQVVGWTRADGYEENKATLKAIAESFRKTGRRSQIKEVNGYADSTFSSVGSNAGSVDDSLRAMGCACLGGARR